MSVSRDSYMAVSVMSSAMEGGGAIAAGLFLLLPLLFLGTFLMNDTEAVCKK